MSKYLRLLGRLLQLFAKLEAGLDLCQLASGSKALQLKRQRLLKTGRHLVMLSDVLADGLHA